MRIIPDVGYRTKDAGAGSGMPDRRTRKMTFYRLSTTLSVAHGCEMMVKEGAWNKFRWRLTECG